MNWLRFSGIVGVTLFFFGLLGAFFVDFTHPLMVFHMVAGIVLIAIWVAFVGVKSLSDAGQLVKGRHARFGANVVLYTAVFIGILTAINWYGNQHNKRWDLTEQRVYSLSDQTVTTLKGLKKPLRLIAFKGNVPDGGDEQALQELFTRYLETNREKVRAEFVDPRAKPHLVEKYEMSPGNLVYLEYGDGEKNAVSRINEGTEEALTNAILKLTRGEAKKLYVVEGHDEPGISQGDAGGLKEFAAAMKDEHLTVEGILLSQKGSIPEDAAAVILVSPKKPLLPEEKKLLVDYGKSGGRLLLLTDPRTTGDVAEIASSFGIKVGQDVVIDQIQRLFAAPQLGAQPIAVDYDTSSPVTKNFSKRTITIFNIASSLGKTGSESGVSLTELVKSSPSAWGETDLAGVFEREDATADKGPADVQGPVTLAMSYEKKDGAPAAGSSPEPSFQKVSRVVVFGDSDWLLNANIHVYANRDLAMNAVNWLAGEEGGVSIRPGTMRASAAPLTVAQLRLIMALSFVVPEVMLLLGLFIWYRRRAISV